MTIGTLCSIKGLSMLVLMTSNASSFLLHRHARFHVAGLTFGLRVAPFQAHISHFPVIERKVFARKFANGTTTFWVAAHALPKQSLIRKRMRVLVAGIARLLESDI